MKKCLKCFILCILSTLITGCGYVEIVDIDSNGNATEVMSEYLTADESKGDDSYIRTEQRNGTTYYVYKMTKVFDAETGEYKFVRNSKTEGASGTVTISGITQGDPRVTIDAKTFEYRGEAISDETNDEANEMLNSLSSLAFYEIVVNFPEPVSVTNGILSNDNKTVTFSNDELKDANVLYAYVDSTRKPPVIESNLEISLLGLNKYSNLNKNKTLKVKANSIITNVTLDGNDVDPTGFKVTKQGKHTVKVFTEDGNKSFSFYMDKTKPKVNVKPKIYKKKVKLKFSDKHSGIKSAKLDNKKIKSGYICKKKGKHKLTLIDKCGNKVVVIFKVM